MTGTNKDAARMTLSAEQFLKREGYASLPDAEGIAHLMELYVQHIYHTDDAASKLAPPVAEMKEPQPLWIQFDCPTCRAKSGTECIHGASCMERVLLARGIIQPAPTEPQSKGELPALEAKKCICHEGPENVGALRPCPIHGTPQARHSFMNLANDGGAGNDNGPQEVESEEPRLPPLDEEFWRWRDQCQGRMPDTHTLLEQSRKSRERQLLATIAERDAALARAEFKQAEVEKLEGFIRQVQLDAGAATDRILELESTLRSIREQEVEMPGIYAASWVEIMAAKDTQWCLYPEVRKAFTALTAQVAALKKELEKRV